MYEIENPRGARPPAIDRSYRRWRQMQADMSRYYEKCKSSPKARRLRGSRGKEYCARTAWMILRSAGRYPDYPAFRRRAEHRPYVSRESGVAEMVLSNPALENPLLFENPLSSGAKAAIGIGVAAAAIGVGAWLFMKYQAAQQTKGDLAVTLTPGSLKLTGFVPGHQIAVGLPTNATWTSLQLDGTLVPVVGNAPATLHPANFSGTIAASWIDGQGTAQSATIAYSA